MLAKAMQKISCCPKNWQYKLFGSVTNKEVAEEIIKQTGMDLDKKKVSIGDSIKMLGERTAVIKLHPKVTAEVTVKIVEA